MTIQLGTTLWDSVNRTPIDESPEYLQQQLVTYIGNKRALLPLIRTGIHRAQRRLGKQKLRTLDAFAGSGVVSRLLKGYSELLISNDFEAYSAVIARCYLANQSNLDLDVLRDIHAKLRKAAEQLPVQDGFIRRLYAPAEDDNIKAGERVFYTSDNAARIDSYRTLINKIPRIYQDFFLAPLLVQASIHANTSGVFKGFYKSSRTGIGQFGGNGRDALSRIMRPISVPFPIFSRFETDVVVRQEDANQLVETIDEVDLAYFDPPYNQHPYGSNYFMLNLIVDYVEPRSVSPVSGIPDNWQRSNYNKRRQASNALAHLLEATPASYILLSYNDEGFVSRSEFEILLSQFGRFEVLEEQYNTFRGCRNLHGRSKHVTEQLFLLEKS